MATQQQSIVADALGELGLQAEPPTTMGGPVVFVIDEATAERLKGRTVEVGSDGRVSVR